jgi:hypothetical protein
MLPVKLPKKDVLARLRGILGIVHPPLSQRDWLHRELNIMQPDPYLTYCQRARELNVHLMSIIQLRSTSCVTLPGTSRDEHEKVRRYVHKRLFVEPPILQKELVGEGYTIQP